MTDVTDYLQHAKATRQRIIEAGLRHARDVARREAEATARALQRAKSERTAGMSATDPELRAQIAAVLVAHGRTWADIVSHQRARYLHPPRQDVYAILRARGWSLPIIARFCNRDHTSILYALRKHAERDNHDDAT